MQYLRARYYEPGAGRMMTKDPYWNPGNMIYGSIPQSLSGLGNYAPSLSAIRQSGNLYTYCVNNPLAFADPSGLAHATPDDTSGKSSVGTKPWWESLWDDLFGQDDYEVILQPPSPPKPPVPDPTAPTPPPTNEPSPPPTKTPPPTPAPSDACTETESYRFINLTIDTDGRGPNIANSKHHQDQTSYFIKKGKDTIYLDATKINYVVREKNTFYDGTAQVGDIAVIIDHSTGEYVYAIIGDIGKEDSYHEVSIKAAWDLGYDTDGTWGPKGDFEVIYFPGTAKKWDSMEALEEGLDKYAEQFYP